VRREFQRVMIDYFALLGEARRPWLDSESLKAKFLSSSAQTHPDRAHHQGAAEQESAHRAYLDLNAGYQCLREPRERLRHLLELELDPASPRDQTIPPEISALFMEIGPVCRQADQLLRQKSGITSPLLKVQWFENSRECRGALDALGRKLDDRSQALLEGLKALDSEWIAEGREATRRAALLSRLEDTYRQLSFIDRWRKQLRERIVQFNL
jgi:DnaJ-domain-containing protein 1